MRSIEVARASDLGFDTTGGAWVALCNSHHTLVNVATKKAASSVSGIDFCDACREEETCQSCGAQVLDELACHSAGDWCVDCCPCHAWEDPTGAARAAYRASKRWGYPSPVVGTNCSSCRADVLLLDICPTGGVCIDCCACHAPPNGY